MVIILVSSSPACFAFNNKNISELLNKVKTNNPATSFLYKTELCFQYPKKEKKATLGLSDFTITFLSFNNNEHITAITPGIKAIKKSVL